MSPNTTPNTANIRAWVDALRSGHYEQGRGALRRERPGGAVVHCCLGVACEVAIAHGADIERSGDRYDGTPYFLPDAVCAWLGLPDDNPPLDGDAPTTRNDRLRQNFGEIADAIEKEYLA